MDGSYTYFNLLVYQAMEYASGHGLDRLHLGLASCAKVERGAVASPLWTAAVQVGAADRPPGLTIVDPAALRRWSEPYSRYSHALPAQAWALPSVEGPARRSGLARSSHPEPVPGKAGPCE